MSKDSGAFTAPFDKAKYDELVALRSDVKNQFNESGDKLLTMSDGSDETPDMNEYAKEGKRYSVLKDRLNSLNDEIEGMEIQNTSVLDVKPVETDLSMALRDYLKAEDPHDVMASQDFKMFTDESIPGSAKIPLGSFHIPANTHVMTTGAVRSDNATGQNAVDVTTMPGIVEALKEYGGVSKMCGMFSTATGEDFIMPQVDNKDETGEVITIAQGQGTDVNQDVGANIGKVTFKTNTISTKAVPVTNEMIQDAVFDVVGWVRRSLIRRIGRTMNSVTTNGLTGTNFRGVLQDAKAGHTAGSQTAIAYDDMVDLEYSVDPAYRQGFESGEGGFRDSNDGMVGYMFHESVEQILAKLVDMDGRPLWRVSTREGIPNMFNGYPYAINQDMPAVAAGATPALFGNFGHYMKRDIAGLSIYNFFDSNTAKANERHIYGFKRADARYAGPLVSNLAEGVAKLTMAS